MVIKIRQALLELLECSLRNLGSSIGVYLRRLYFKRRLKACGRDLRIDCGVFLTNPEYITFGDSVVLDKHVIIIAGPAGNPNQTKRIANASCKVPAGEVKIGSKCHLGIGTIVQGHGGVTIGDFFTSSSRCMIYSFSNDPYRCRTGTVGGATNEVHYVETPVSIGHNVWLGLQSIVVGNTIGDNVFLKPNSVAAKDIDSNQVAEGQPARSIGSRFL